MSQSKTKIKSISNICIWLFYAILTVLIVGTVILFCIISTDTRDKNICIIKSPDGLYTVNFQQAICWHPCNKVW